MVLCSHIVEEINRVVKRKFTHKIKFLDEFLKELPYELVYTPAFLEIDKLPLMKDEYDYPILATAILAEVEVIITGDKDFTAVHIDHPEILTPTEFLSKY